MNKRKIVLLAVALCMVAILAVGGTLAYFTDTDMETNTFTVGNVNIDLVEDFEQKSKLFPGKQNAVQKEVWIEIEDGSEDCYVWYEYLIPAILDSTDGSTGTNNIVHVNAYGYTWDQYRENANYWPDWREEALAEEYTWDHTSKGTEGFIGKETIDGTEYNKYVVLYHGMLSNNTDADGIDYQDKTTPAMSQVYLDQGVNNKIVDGKTVYVDKNGNVINFNLADDIEIIVRAYAMQAAGFDNVYAAYDAYQAQSN